MTFSKHTDKIWIISKLDGGGGDCDGADDSVDTGEDSGEDRSWYTDDNTDINITDACHTADLIQKLYSVDITKFLLTAPLAPQFL